MSKIIKNSVDTLKKGIDSLKTIKKDKREYREYLARIKALPEDYRFVFEKAENYMWRLSGSSDGCDIMAAQAGMLELFEESAAEKKPVLKITGSDVAAFCDELLRDSKTWAGNRRDSLNRSIMKKLEKSSK